MSSNIASAPFSRAVVSAMLLLEAPFDPLRRQMNSVLLTVDLTKAVVDEAIERNDSIVVAYHPIIFKGLKSITLDNSQQQSLLRLAAEGISVYSPHTALDAAPGGICDWLADIVTGTPVTAAEDQKKDDDSDSEKASIEEDPFLDKRRPVYMLQHHPSHRDMIKDADLKLGATRHTRNPITALDIPGVPGAGMGRIVRFNEPQPLSAIIDRVARGVGNPKGFPIAIPQGKSVEDMSIRSIAICAGSGGSMFANLKDIDLLFTGELSHHEALGAIEKGQCVITLFHSNSERGFLHTVLKTQLEEKVKVEWEEVRKAEQEKEGVSEELYEALDDEYVTVEVSERDRDPYGLVISRVGI
ncbi:Diphthine methyl ester synthase [Venturia inaequalis]|nr:Diphthine methyl ester synthase [Venturia inaequalis]